MGKLDGMRQRNIDAPLVEVDIGLFADKVGVTTTNTLDLRQSVHDLALAINVSVEETQDVLSAESISSQITSNTAPHGPEIVGGARARRETWWAKGK